MTTNQVYIATVLLEKNRWDRSKDPEFILNGKWLSRFQNAGFDGVEVWENHLIFASERQLQEIENHALPLKIYSSYYSFDSTQQDLAKKSADLIQRFKPASVKFNFGPNKEKMDCYIENFIAWKQKLPPNTLMLCECHANMALDEPKIVQKILSRVELEEVRLIMHAFSEPLEELKHWFDLFAAKISHIHVTYMEGEQRLTLARAPEINIQRMNFLNEQNFSGTFTTEFTEGVHTPHESHDDLFFAAIQDMHFIKTHVPVRD